MTDSLSRRAFVRSAAGATALGAGAGAAGTATAQSEQPDFGGYIDGAKGGSFADERGSGEVTVEVGAGSGGLAFAPTGLWIDTGTTVTFEWVGSQSHNVLFEGMPSGAGVEGYSEVVGSGTTYEVTFDTGGVYTYFCQPHKGLGMKGAIAVGDDVPTVEVESESGGGGSSRPKVPDSAKTIGVATSVAMLTTLGLTYFFVKYGGDYSPPE
ncbi:plastocyanin/azurin family copper-binding protein [Halobaculum sp. MBLA0147]|uniref:plastocyanin/azurin family copper-binding protein n=1 Tax=Halobaculum sp. MBLA0147 TaxID=3079934 RepID=UPI003524FE60